MRPAHLKIRGFTSFRRRVEIDFADFGLFAIAGPTGSGKSSVLDAITFALFGKAPRVGDGVKELISLGLDEASVSFEFSAAGVPYRVTRTIRAAAPTKIVFERSESGEWAPYGEDSDKVRVANKQIVKVIGLEYDAFTRAVLLPQGRFAEFLSGEAKDRRSILIELLGFELFRRMATRAGEIAKHAQMEIAAKIDLLGEEYAGVDKAALTAAQQDAQLAAEELDKAKEVAAAVDEIAAKWSLSRQQADAISQLRSEVAGTRDTLSEQADQVGAAMAETVEVEKALTESTRELQRATSHKSKLIRERDKRRDHWGADHDVRALHAQAVRLSELRAELEREESEAEKVRTKQDALRNALEGHEQALAAARHQAAGHTKAVEEAQTARDHAHSEHMAASITVDVRKGDPCPICGRPLEDKPRFSTMVLDKAQNQLRAAQRAEEEGRSLVEKLSNSVAEAKVELGSTRRELELTEKNTAALAHKIDTQVRQLREAFGGRLPKDPIASAEDRVNRLAKLVADIDAVDAELEGLREVAQQDQARATELKSAVAESRALAQGSRLPSLLTRCSTTVPGLAPEPDLPRTVPRDGSELQEYLRSAILQLQQLADALSAEAEGLLQGESAFVEQIRDAVPAAFKVRGRTVTSLTDGMKAMLEQRIADAKGATSNVETLKKRLKNKEKLERQVEAAGRTHAQYEELARELRANNLIQFLLDEALRTLAASAADRLEYLSERRYRLSYKGNEFFVVDHWNADEERPAKTLSGGETFLASLALALALSDEVQGLSISETARLESLFLDEGFGTLDDELLETVISALDQLGGEGRMIGVITHIADIAYQLPIVLEVVKSQEGSGIGVSDRPIAGSITQSA